MSSSETGAGHRRGGGRQALIEALVRVAAREGLTQVTTRSVATEAGVTHGLVRHHFGTLEAMIEEALAWAASEAVIGSGLRAEGGDLTALASDLAALIDEDPEHAAFQLEVILEARHRDGLRERVQAELRHVPRGRRRVAGARGPALRPRPGAARLRRAERARRQPADLRAPRGDRARVDLATPSARA